jgi:hypothetical protein
MQPVLQILVRIKLKGRILIRISIKVITWIHIRINLHNKPKCMEDERI